MFNCLCINDLFSLQRYKNFWTFLLFSLCFKALSTIYMQVGNFSYFISIMGGTTSYLPLCMGVCPRDNYTNACKLENVDFHIEDSLVNYIDTMYEAKTAK